VIERILIVRTDRLGDVIATLPMVSVIKERLPSVKVTVMVRSYTEPLLELAPEVDEVLLFDTNFSLKRKIQLFESARADVAFFPSPNRDIASAALFSRIPQRVGTAYRWYSSLFTDKIYDHRKTAEYHESEYNIRMLEAIDIHSVKTPRPSLKLSEKHLIERDTLLTELFGNPSKPYAVIHLGTGGSTREWSKSAFEELAVYVAQRLSLPIVLTGTEGDREQILSVSHPLQGVGADVKLFIGHGLIALAEVMSNATIVIAGSTGPGHLAAALGAPTVGLFPLAQALSKERWGFRGPNTLNLAPSEIATVSCPMCKDCTCIQQIRVSDVIVAVDRLMGS